MEAKIRLIFSVFLLVSFGLYSQTDSLLQVVKTTENDSLRGEALYYLTFQYVNSDTHKARSVNSQALQLAQKVKSNYALARAFNAKGVIYDVEGKTDSAYLSYQKGLQYAEKSGSKLTRASVLNNIGLLEWNKGNYDTALQYYNQSLELFERIDNKNGIANTQSNIGLIYYDLKEYEKAEKYTFKALEIRELQKDKYGISVSYTNLSLIASDNMEKQKAIQYSLKALAYKKELEDERGMAMVYNNLTALYLDIKQPEQAIYYGNLSLKINEKIDSKLNLSYTYGILGDAYIMQKSYQKAREYILKSFELCEEIDNKPVMVENYKRLEEIETKIGHYKEAYYYLKKRDSVSQIIFNLDKEKAISEIEFKYQDEKKEKALLVQEEQLVKNKLVIKNNRLTITSLVLSLLLLAILGFAYFMRQRHLKRQLEREMELQSSIQQIETQNHLQQERLRISRDLHDNIGSQLTFIVSTLDNFQYRIKKKMDLNTAQIADLGLFTKNTIQELRDTIWALNQKEITTENTRLRVQNLLEKARTSFPTIEFTLQTECQNNLILSSLQSINLLRVIQEAINNAVKYADSSRIEVYWIETDHALTVKVVDNGKGFDLHTVSTGFGLNNMQKRIDEIGASINLQSQIGEGTVVEITMVLSGKNT